MECNRSFLWLLLSGVFWAQHWYTHTHKKVCIFELFWRKNYHLETSSPPSGTFSEHYACKVKSCLCLCDLPRPCARGETLACAEFSGVLESFLRASWVSRVPVITSRSREAGSLLRVLPGTAQSNNSPQKANQVDPHHIFTRLQTPNPFTL